ncbi:hypothetical protein D0Y65_015070 [Glycine soja]|uniref:Aldehyde dehydrogenase domain-containing protein n=1 Tax=Glycine soja TaxID=3848 RepID=A0A445KBP1_GLYSO|nr:hypothetical protein D0Y65_015070 [Glycine soja]
MAFATSPSPPTFKYNQTLVSIFNGEAYDYWSIQMQTLFISQDLWDVIENDYPVPESQDELATWTTAKQKEYKQNQQHNAKALLFIQQGVSREIFPRIMQAKNAKEAWETLKNEFKGTNKADKVELPLVVRLLHYYAGERDQANHTFELSSIDVAFKVGPALACGNTLVVKTAKNAPLTGLFAAQLFHEVPLMLHWILRNTDNQCCIGFYSISNAYFVTGWSSTRGSKCCVWFWPHCWFSSCQSYGCGQGDPLNTYMSI